MQALDEVFIAEELGDELLALSVGRDPALASSTGNTKR